MLSLSAVAWLPIAEHQGEVSDWWVLADLLLGVAAYLLVCLRRRHPVVIAVALSVAGAVSGIAVGPMTLAAVSLATRRRWREVVPIGLLAFVSAQVYTALTSTNDDPFWLVVVVNGVATSAMFAWGMYIGSRRELVWTLRQRAERAEEEQELRVAQARGTERSRIAREMHDVLAHRITQISMHAGALAYREDLTADQMRSNAGVIRDQAHRALEDLRDVLGVLRDDDPERRVAPQPTYADLRDLIADGQRAGMWIEVEDLLAEEPMPDAVGRTVYRIVQEGITNARKHAPGVLLSVRIAGSPDDGVEMVLSNPLGFGPSATPGAGLGLIGLAERVELRGGRLTSGRRGGRFEVRAWIPWAS